MRLEKDRLLFYSIALSLSLIVGCSTLGLSDGGGESLDGAVGAGGRCAFDASPGDEAFDLVIANGRVMDPECGFDGVRNVAIRGDEIAVITTSELSGKVTIDATGHVVAPGFIDTHTHSSDEFAIKMSMMDGVTTGLDLEVGAMNLGAWYEREAGQWPMNYGQSVSQELARMIVHDGLEIAGPADARDIFRFRAAAVEDEVSAGLVDTPDPFRVLENPFLAVNLSLIVGHLDLLGHDL